MATLYLIDGYGQFFRAFHAIRTPMTSPVTKEPTNMTFGFLGMLLKLIRGEGSHAGGAGEGAGRATHVAVALDVSGDRGTFRSVLYPEYKAHRPEIPEGLPPQIERCVSLLREVGVPLIGAEGFEADDAIATVVERLGRERPGLTIRIVSKDKDLKQLLREGGGGLGAVELYDVQTDTLMTAGTLRAETGLSPGQVVDMLALMGDSVDNVPGVEGVGEKTAAALVAEHGSMEAVLAAADRIGGKRGERIRAAAGMLPLSKELVRLRSDAPVELDLSSAEVGSFRLERLVPICRELGFNRYQQEVAGLLASRGVKVESAEGGGGGGSGGEGGGGSRGGRRGGTGTRAGDGPGLFDGVEAVVGSGEGSSGGEVGGGGTDGSYEAVVTVERLREVVELLRRAPVVGVDTETTGLNPRTSRLCGVSLSDGAGRGWYVPVRSPRPLEHLDEATAVRELRGVLEDERRPKCGHNLKFDLMVLRAAGIRLRGIAPPRDWVESRDGAWGGGDTMVASYLIDSSRSSHSKDALCLALLGRENIPISSLIGSGTRQRSFEEVELESATPYAAEDADVTLQLAGVMWPLLREMGLVRLWEDVELPLVEVLAELEWNGIRVDPVELDRQRARLEGRIAELRGAIDAAAMAGIGRTFNPDSPKQLSAALFNDPGAMEPGLGLKSVKKTKTGHSTDIEVLEKLAGDAVLSTPPGAAGPTPIPGLIVEYRQLTKLVGTYLVALRGAIDPVTGRVHASFNQTVAATGRLSSSDPNLQNIPIRTEVGREIRRAFVAEAGKLLVSADYSQIELRLLAHLSRDPELTRAFEEDADIHTAVAAQIHGVEPTAVTREMRSGAKMVNFGIVYGITAYGLARRLGIGEREAGEIIAGYKRKFAGITTFLQECVAQAREKGWVETILRRRRPIVGIGSKNPAERSLAERTAINSVVQGSAADLIKVAMVDLHRRIGESGGDGGELEGTRMLLQIHDELVFECPAERAEAARRVIVERMERAMELSVPLKVESGVSASWYEGK